MRWREAVGKGPVAPSTKGTSSEFGLEAGALPCGDAGASAWGEVGAWACGEVGVWTGGKACGTVGVVAGDGGTPAITGPPPILAGRAGGSGVAAVDFILAAGSCAAAPFIDAIASAAIRQPRMPIRDKPLWAAARKRAASSIGSSTAWLSAVDSEA